MNTKDNTKVNAKYTQLTLDETLEKTTEVSDSDYALWNRCVPIVAISPYVLLDLLNTLEACDANTFNYSGNGVLTWKEVRDNLIKALE